VGEGAHLVGEEQGDSGGITRVLEHRLDDLQHGCDACGGTGRSTAVTALGPSEHATSLTLLQVTMYEMLTCQRS